MGGGLVGDGVGPDPAAHQLGEHLGRVAEEPDGERFSLGAGALDHGQRLVQVARLAVEVAGAQPHLDARRLALDGEHGSARHGGGERLRPAHAAEAPGEDPPARERAAVVTPPDLREGLVGALHDALRADVDPGPRGHLAVHHEPGAIELVEMVPGRVGRDQVRVGDEDAGRVRMGAEHAHRLARLHQQGFVALELAQARDDAVEAVPIARGAADAPVDDQRLRLLGHLRIEVVHQHPQRRLREPAPGRDVRPARRADAAGVVEAGAGDHGAACPA